MKNKLLQSNSFKKMLQSLLLFFLFLTGFASFSQTEKNPVVSKNSKIVTVSSLEKNPIKEIEQLQRETPELPPSYTATKVSLSSSASIEDKENFKKKYNADYYYVYSDSNGKIISKEEVEMALKLQQNNTINRTQINNIKK